MCPFWPGLQVALLLRPYEGMGHHSLEPVTRKRRMKFMSISLAVAFVLGLSLAVGHAQDFAADVVYTAATKANASSAATGTSSDIPSKLYVSKDKMRLETRGLTGTVLLVNGKDHTAVALFPSQHAYQNLASAPSEYFRVEDPENACPEWAKATEQKIVCEKVGHEVLDGRKVVKYKNKAATNTATTAVWIDLALKFVIKWETASTGAELHNITEAQQAADLFTVPSGLNVLQPRKTASKGFSKRR